MKTVCSHFHFRWAFQNKLHNCAKDVALHCHKNESRSIKKNIQRSFAQHRAYKEQKYCDGVNFRLSFPLLKHNQCERSYVAVKEKCESSYVATYKGNKVDETLCGYVSTAANQYISSLGF